MKQIFLTVYAILIATVTVLFLIFGEPRDSRFYVALLILAVIGKLISKRMDSRA